MVTEVYIRRKVRTRARCNNRLLEMQDFMGFITPYLEPVAIDKTGTAVNQIHAVPCIELGSQLDLLADHLLRILQNAGKRKPARLADIPEHLVGVKGDDLLDRVTQRFGRNGAPVSAVTANRGFIFDDCDTLAVFRRIHRCTFSRRARADNDDVVMMFCHSAVTPYLRREGASEKTLQARTGRAQALFRSSRNFYRLVDAGSAVV